MTTSEKPDYPVWEAAVAIEESALVDIVSWAQTEIESAESDRQSMMTDLVEIERLYEQRPKQKIKNFPWPNSANLVVPEVATAVESVLARIINAVFGGGELWMASGRTEEWRKAQAEIGKWLNHLAKDKLDLYNVCRIWFLYTCKFGTGVLKLPWVTKSRSVTYQSKGQIYKESQKIFDGPKPSMVDLKDFYISSDALHRQDVQDCEWVAHRVYYTRKQLKEMEYSGAFQNVDLILDNPRTATSDLEEEQERNAGVSPSNRTDYEVIEFWASYDVDKDGELEEIVVTFERTSGIVLSAYYNFYQSQKRPFEIIRYMPRTGSFYGIGLGKMLKDIQEEISTIHNQRLDNATLANMVAFKVKKDADIDPSEIYPGAKIPVDDMDDMAELPMYNQHHTLLQEELHSSSIGEKRTGVSDYTVGRESAAIGSRATATSTMALIGEANKRFKMVIRDVRESLASIGKTILEMYQQFGDIDQVYLEAGEELGSEVEKIFQLPTDSTVGLKIDTPTISETYNKDLEKQTYLTLMGMMKQFYQSLIEALAVAQNPQAPPSVKYVATHGAQQAIRIWEKVLEAFDFYDADTYLPDMQAFMMGGDPNGVNAQTMAAQAQGGAGPAGAGPSMADGQSGVVPVPTESPAGTQESGGLTAGGPLPG